MAYMRTAAEPLVVYTAAELLAIYMECWAEYRHIAPELLAVHMVLAAEDMTAGMALAADCMAAGMVK